MTLRAVQTVKVCKFGQKNGISDVKKGTSENDLPVSYLFLIYYIFISLSLQEFGPPIYLDNIKQYVLMEV